MWIVLSIITGIAVWLAILFLLRFVLYGVKQIITHYYTAKLEYVRQSLRLSSPLDEPSVYSSK